MKRQFNTDYLWVWIIHGVVTVACLIMYFMIDGRELVFALYIPLDILLNLSKVAFFWHEYSKHNKKLSKKQ